MRPILLTLLLLALPVHATVQSETIFFLEEDGLGYLLERSIHSASPSHRFHVDKSIRLDDLRHVSPARFEWDDQSSDKVNSLSFDAGGFTLIYPGRFNDSELRRDPDGTWHYKSWNGTRNAAGMYGYWYSTGRFDQFTYTWILPDNIELLRYRSNQRGTWTRRNNAISFYAEQVNNLTFEISYKVTHTEPAPPTTATTEGVAEPITAIPSPSRADCPPAPPVAPTPAPVQPIAFSASPTPPRETSDSDGDGISDIDDLCPGSLAGGRVDQVGCPLDSDHDGVPDGVDQCIATREETPVDAQGCEFD